MTDLRRRELLQLLATASLPGLIGWTPAGLERTVRSTRRALEDAALGTPYQPKFFTAHEWETVRLLADLILPQDERSGSATDAGVPEFIDFVMVEFPDNQTPIRGGLAWLDIQCRERYGKAFVECAESERTSMLDEIAWPRRAQPELSQGVAFFNTFRDLVASGFWSSKIGVEDLGYVGNTFVTEWKGCPEDALRKLGVGNGD